jgi:putative transport protein
MPAPVKLGLAGGPLLVAIVLSRLGHVGPLVWHLPTSASFALREVGIVLFLGCVGVKSGEEFFHTLAHGPGLYWMACGVIITLVPLLTVALFARMVMKMNYMTVCGLLAGSMTDPPALQFAGTVTQSDAPSIAYAAVYPLVMLLRVLAAQALVLMFV